MKGTYLYDRLASKLVVLTKRRCKEKSLQQNKEILQQKEIGYTIYLVLLSLFQFVVVFGICYLIKNTTINTLIIFISFVFMRAFFGISYHAKTVLSCTTISVLIFTLATRVSLPLYISILCNILIGLLIAYILFIIAQNETNSKLLEKYKVNVSMMDKDSIMIKFGLSEIEASMIYDYYHRENFETVEDIADRYHYNKMKIYRLLKKISSV
jgi:accessory gene regulator protein AgrB